MPDPTPAQLNNRNADAGFQRTPTGAYNAQPATATVPATTPAVSSDTPATPTAERTPTPARVNPVTIGANDDQTGGSDQSNPSPYDLLTGSSLTDEEKAPVIDKYNKDITASVDKIDQDYDQKLLDKSQGNSALSGRVATISANSGTAGSGSGEARAAIQTGKNNEVMKQLDSQRQNAVGTTLAKIDSLEASELRADQAAKSKDYASYTKLSSQNKKDALTATKELGKHGISWDTFQKDPAYQTLLKQYGGDPVMLKAAYLSGLPADKVITHFTQGNQLFYVTKNADGSTSTDSVALPVPSGVDLKNYTMMHDTGSDSYIFVPKQPNIDHSSTKSTADQIKDQSIVIPLTPKVPKPKVGTSGSINYSSDDIGTINKALDSTRGDDNYVNTVNYVDGYNRWEKKGGSAKDWIRLFPPNLYLNPSDKSIPAVFRSYMKTPKAGTSTSGGQTAEVDNKKVEQVA